MVSEQRRDKKGVYREFQGVRYNYWPKRGIYVSQIGGKQTMLHRKFYEASCFIPEAHAVVPLGSWEDFGPCNWVCRPHADNGRHFVAVQPHTVFKGIKYYLDAVGKYYYHTRTDTKKDALHRVICAHYHGEIPKGFDVHHIDFDHTNNDSTNLVALSKADHTKLHAAEKKRASV